MNAIVATVAPIANRVSYDMAMTIAGRLDNNFKTLRDNKRKLAHSLVCASVVEGYALSEAITDAKAKAKWNKLASDEQNQLNVLFTAVRTIDGAWKALSLDVQKDFIAGEIVYSTLAKRIKDAEKEALAAKDKADDGEAVAEQARNEPVGDDGWPEAVAPTDAIVEAMAKVEAFIDAQAGAGDMSEAQLLRLFTLKGALEAFEARVAAAATVAKAA
jgi:uncharacterized protein YdaT